MFLCLSLQTHAESFLRVLMVSLYFFCDLLQPPLAALFKNLKIFCFGQPAKYKNFPHPPKLIPVKYKNFHQPPKLIPPNYIGFGG